MNQSPILTLGISFFMLPLAACVISVGGASCSLVSIQGSGVEATEAREVESFERVRVSGSADVIVHVGGQPGLSLRGDDNLLEYVTTEVRGDTLRIGMKSGSYSFKRGLEIEISTPELSGLALSGSSDAVVNGVLGDEFSASISGSGSIRASGRVDRLDSRVSGSGEMDLSELQSREARVGISGSAEVIVHASETLDVSISGSGDVRYEGNPRISQSVSGSGDVSRR